MTARGVTAQGLTAPGTTRIRRVAAICVLLLACAGALAVPGMGTGTAYAAGYRYWSFWESDGGKWTYATQGPALARPADGAVNGFRFAVSADSRDAANPREAPDFAAVCGGTPPVAGRKRVAVVIDAGTPADAPEGETPPASRAACARIGAEATSADALAAVAKPLRYNSQALLCAISGYPKSGCGEQVSGDGESDGNGNGGAGAGPDSGSESESESESGDTAGTAPSPGPEGSDTADESGGGGPSVGLLAGGAAVLALAAAGIWQARRRRA